MESRIAVVRSSENEVTHARSRLGEMRSLSVLGNKGSEILESITINDHARRAVENPDDIRVHWVRTSWRNGRNRTGR